MPTITLSNTATQINQTLSEHYNRLVGSYVGPLTANSNASAGFIIQNANKDNGILVANNGTLFYNNTLCFNDLNSNARLIIPSTRSFVVTGANVAFGQFCSNAFSIGSGVNANCNGLQMTYSTPNILLNDCSQNAINGSGCQSIIFFDRTGYNHTRIGICFPTIECGATSQAQSTLQIFNHCNLQVLNNSGSAFLIKDNRISLFAGNRIHDTHNFYLSGNAFVSSDFTASGICSNSYIYSVSNNNIQSGRGINSNVGVTYIQPTDGYSHFVDYVNSSGAVHSQILVRQSSELEIFGGASSFQIYGSTPGSLGFSRRQLFMELNGRSATSNSQNILLKVQGDIESVFNICSRCVCTNNIRISANSFYGLNSKFCYDGFEFYCTAGVSVIQNNRFVDVVRGHRWNYTGTNGIDCLLFSSGSGLYTNTSITSLSGICSSGFLCINNTGQCTKITQNCVEIFSRLPLSISGNLCVSGSVSATGDLCARNICSTGSSSNCFSGNIHSPVFCSVNAGLSSSYIGLGSQGSSIGVYTPYTACANCIVATCTISGCEFRQGTTALNCFLGNINVGSNCAGLVQAKNTIKAMAKVFIKNGWVVNNTEINSNGFNVSYITAAWENGLAFRGVYRIVLKDAVVAPINFFGNIVLDDNNILPPYTTGFANFDVGTAYTNGVYPVTVNFMPVGKIFDNGINDQSPPAPLSNGTPYKVLYFTMLNSNLYQTNWNSTVVGSIISPSIFYSNVAMINYGNFSQAVTLRGCLNFMITSS